MRVDPARLAAHNLDPATVSRRLAQENLNASGGSLLEGSTEYLVRTRNEFETIEEIAELIGLTEELTRLSGELSHGQKQWLEIGMLLAQDPRLLLVDEPAAGMTPAEREKTTTMLVEAARKHAVVVVEHDMEFVRLLNAPVVVLNEGLIMAPGSMEEVQADERVVEAYLGR